MEEDILFVCLFFKIYYYYYHLEISQTTVPLVALLVKLLMSRGASRWFHNDLTYSEKVIEY
jgi:hypothetical protein